MQGGVRNFSALKFIGGILILVIAGGSFVFASFFNTNSTKNNIEYGQGIYQIKACDSYVKLNLISGPTHEFGAPEGFSALKGISISSLDTRACDGTTFTISATNIDGVLLPIFRTDGLNSLCTDAPCSNGLNSSDGIKLIVNKSGVTLEDQSNLALKLDPSSGIYSLEIIHPTILANDIDHLLVQSGSS